MKLLKIVTSHFTVSVVERLLLRVVSLVLSVLLLPLATTALAPVGDCKLDMWMVPGIRELCVHINMGEKVSNKGHHLPNRHLIYLAVLPASPSP